MRRFHQVLTAHLQAKSLKIISTTVFVHAQRDLHDVFPDVYMIFQYLGRNSVLVIILFVNSVERARWILQC